jgi:hypothetical protein
MNWNMGKIATQRRRQLVAIGQLTDAKASHAGSGPGAVFHFIRPGLVASAFHRLRQQQAAREWEWVAALVAAGVFIYSGSG